ncbi:MAG: leucine-rich repeat domain-containing protein [Peptococcaceae bacterium]|nr:leucine-rich repeat domain-containing protein [Peptococcaceae bacterium]
MAVSLAVLVLLSCCLTGCDAINNFIGGNQGSLMENIPAAIDLETASDEDCFLWNGGTITGLTEKGKAQVNVVVPKKATSIDKETFARNTAIKSVGFQNPGIVLGEGLFMDCASLEMALLPTNLHVIPISLFKGCRALKEIVIPDQVTKIDNMAFFQCTSLESAEHGGKIESIGRQAFHTCDKLKEFEFSPSINVIGEGAFAWCYELESVVLTSTEQEILEVRTFSNCVKLTKVVIPEGVKKLDVGVFAQCPRLTDITLPASLEEIDTGAFKNTAALNAEPKKYKVVEGSPADLSFGSYSTQFDAKEYQ